PGLPPPRLGSGGALRLAPCRQQQGVAGRQDVERSQPSAATLTTLLVRRQAFQLLVADVAGVEAPPDLRRRTRPGPSHAPSPGTSSAPRPRRSFFIRRVAVFPPPPVRPSGAPPCLAGSRATSRSRTASRVLSVPPYCARSSASALWWTSAVAMSSGSGPGAATSSRPLVRPAARAEQVQHPRAHRPAQVQAERAGALALARGE